MEVFRYGTGSIPQRDQFRACLQTATVRPVGLSWLAKCRVCCMDPRINLAFPGMPGGGMTLTLLRHLATGEICCYDYWHRTCRAAGLAMEDIRKIFLQPSRALALLARLGYPRPSKEMLGTLRQWAEGLPDDLFVRSGRGRLDPIAGEAQPRGAVWNMNPGTSLGIKGPHMYRVDAWAFSPLAESFTAVPGSIKLYEVFLQVWAAGIIDILSPPAIAKVS